MTPLSLDHVAFWVADRDGIADAAVARLGMHVIERTDTFTLVGADARRGKLTLFEAYKFDSGDVYRWERSRPGLASRSA